MNQPVTRQQMEAFARALQATKERMANFPQESGQVRALHADFRATDAAGNEWTVAIRSLLWCRMNQGQWVTDEPPAQLFLKPEVLGALQALMPQPATSQPATPQPTVAIPPPPTPSTPLTPPVPTSPPPPPQQITTCRRCRAPLQPGLKFCTKCGAPVSTPARPAPPVVQAAPNCPHCGKPINAGQKFCTGCGTRL